MITCLQVVSASAPELCSILGCVLPHVHSVRSSDSITDIVTSGVPSSFIGRLGQNSTRIIKNVNQVEMI